LEVDIVRKRVALTMRLDDTAPRAAGNAGVERKRDDDHPRGAKSANKSQSAQRSPQNNAAPPSNGNSMMADALAAALKTRRQ